MRPVFRKKDRLVRPFSPHIRRPRHERSSGSAIGVDHRQIADGDRIIGRPIAIRRVAHIRHEPVGIEFFADVGLHRLHIGIVLPQLVAHAPADDARMVVVALDHLAQPLLGLGIIRNHLGIAAAPDRNFGEDQHSLLVEVIEEVGRLRRVHQTTENRARALHQIDVLAHKFVRLGVPRPVAVTHSIEARHADVLTVQEQARGRHLNFADAKPVAFRVQHLVPHRHLRIHRIQLGMVEVPQTHIGGGQRNTQIDQLLRVRRQRHVRAQADTSGRTDDRRQRYLQRLGPCVGDLILHKNLRRAGL